MTQTLFVEAHALEKPLTGVGRYTTTLLRELLAAYPDLRVALGALGRAELDLDGLDGELSRVEVVRNERFTRRAYRLRLVARRAPALEQLFQAGTYDAALFPGFMTIPMQSARPSLTIVHDATVRSSPQDKSLWTRVGYGWMTQQSLASSPCATVSSSAADEIRHHFKVSGELSVLYPIAPRPVAPSQQRENYVLCTGTASPRKNFDVVFRAKQLIGDAGPDVVVVGKGHEHQDVPGLRIHGYVNESDLAELRARAKAVIAPSLSEGFDLPVVEAVAAGTPVIASKIDVHEEVLGSDHPYFFEPDDAPRLAELMLGHCVASDQSVMDRFSAARVTEQAAGLLGLRR